MQMYKKILCVMLIFQAGLAIASQKSQLIVSKTDVQNVRLLLKYLNFTCDFTRKHQTEYTIAQLQSFSIQKLTEHFEAKDPKTPQEAELLESLKAHAKTAAEPSKKTE